MLIKIYFLYQKPFCPLLEKHGIISLQNYENSVQQKMQQYPFTSHEGETKYYKTNTIFLIFTDL